MILDESDIEAENRRHVQSSDAAKQNLKLISSAVDMLTAVARLELDEADDVTFIRLAIRALNSAGAAGKCALAGYWQPAVANVRDLVEIDLLLDLFRRRPAEIARWRNADDRTLKNEFSGRRLRETLDDLDPKSSEFRRLAYELFSQHGTHPRPDRVHLISPDAMTVIGPFPDGDRIIALTFDIARFLSHVTGCVTKWVDETRISDPSMKLAYSTKLIEFALDLAEWTVFDKARRRGT
ncbi:hypothetical protein C7441_11448 [Pseudaminobacter salicylatoxidans]|uniref:Uncharacterized protein n=1 Tax=Pseudaminobacter salicylatoxidans TaxID=93369 RepID=A0A316C043_PSESE|nr:hypothetical protein [Pseudaminobacter salicylatoxidans]PWJ79771.1 hypothetical protein C7441_11448 [Pseudaminobacter salicylatoxidans]